MGGWVSYGEWFLVGLGTYDLLAPWTAAFEEVFFEVGFGDDSTRGQGFGKVGGGGGE